MEGCVPKKILGKKQKSIYLSQDTIKLKDKKAKLWRQYKKTRGNYDLMQYKRAKNKLRSLTRSQRINFENNLAKDIKAQPKKFWAYVKSRTKTRCKIPSLRTKESKASTAAEKAEALNNFFSSVFTDENLDNIPDENDNLARQHLANFEITTDSVLKKLNDLNAGKSPGPDKWHPVFLKNVADLIAEPLAILFNKSLNEGILPSQWLKACITAIHKKGDKGLPENYRPVSITSIICKIMESLVRDKLVEHMSENDLFSKHQHGFVPLLNCVTNLLVCMEKWSEILENNDTVDVIYTDFAKAFDSVPHQRLLVKLKGVGISENVLNWIKAFLSNRFQCVRVEDQCSSWKPVKSGIPQGSVLGPILFVIFINDMPEAVKSMCLLFADDAKLFRNVNLREDTNTEILQHDVDSLTTWSGKWQLPFNIGKCKVLHLGRTNPCNRYKMAGRYLEQVEEETDLGVLVDNELKFHKQTAVATKEANSRLGLIKKSFVVLDNITLPLLYTSLVRSHLEYGNIIWGPFYSEDRKSIERIQKRATKLIPELRDLPYGQRLRHLDLPSMQHRRRRGDMIMTYKIMTGKVKMNPSDIFSLSSNEYRCHQYKLTKKKATKSTSLNAFSNRVVTDWNSLPRDVVSAKTTNSFKNKLDDHWKDEKFENPFD